MQVPVLNIQGETVEKIEVSDAIFGVAFNEPLVHQALVRQLANQRQGTSDTKTRTEVTGSGKKMYPQKHTGHARRGSIRSPLLRKGGIVFGPHPRSYHQAMPVKMRRKALKCVLSSKLTAQDMIVLNELKFDSARTKQMEQVLSALKVNAPALIVTAESDQNVVLSTRNVAQAKALPAALLNVGDLLAYDKLIITTPAVRKVEEIWGKQS